MKKTILIILITLLFSSCDFIRMMDLQSKFGSTLDKKKDSIFIEPSSNTSFTPTENNETTRLYYLCKVWGFLKYYHFNRFRKVINVDSILLQTIPKVISIKDKNNLNQLFYDEVIQQIQQSTITEKNLYKDINQYSLINNDWFNDSLFLDKKTEDKLNYIFNHYNGWKRLDELRFAYNRSNVGTVRRNHEKEYDDYKDENIRLLGLFRYWNLLNYFYPYKHVMDKNWDKVLYESIPIFRNVTNNKSYHQAIYQLTNRLRDTHASYPPTIDSIVFGEYRPKFRMMNINDTLVISSFRGKGDSSFKIGDIILKVNDKDALFLYDSLQTYVCGSTYWQNNAFACNAVLSRYETKTKFTILRGKDTLELFSSNRKAEDLFRDRLKVEKGNEENQLYKWISNDIVYFDLTSATYDNFYDNYDPIKKAKTIILDLRCYPETSLIAHLSDAFVPPSKLFAYITYANTDFPGMLKYHPSSKAIGHKDYYKGQVIVLVNEETGSYSEYVCMLLQANPRTITIGRSSSGSDGNVSMYTFPGGVRTLYTGIGVYYPDMTPTQGVGVKIDHVVEPTYNSIKNKQDLILNKAIELGRSQADSNLYVFRGCNEEKQIPAGLPRFDYLNKGHFSLCP
ncbi:MAG: S41 family peptidase [Hyphomicrobiales bacterium]